jgi:hypothetical protein
MSARQEPCRGAPRTLIADVRLPRYSSTDFKAMSDDRPAVSTRWQCSAPRHRCRLALLFGLASRRRRWARSRRRLCSRRRRWTRCCCRCCSRRRRWGGRGRSRRCWSRACARDKIELADASLPTRVVVLISMPEGHAIARIDGGHTVIPPSVGALRTNAVHHYGFTLAEIVWRIGLETARVTNSRMDGRTGRGIGDRCISILINSYAGHEAP